MREAFAEKTDEIATEMFKLTIDLRNGDLPADKEEMLRTFLHCHSMLCDLVNATQFLSHFLGDDPLDGEEPIVRIIDFDEDTEMP